MSLENLPGLLKSKRFWVSLFGMLVIVISAFDPTLSARFNEIVPAVLVIVGFLVGGYTLEESVQSYSAAKVEAVKAQNVNRLPPPA